MGGGDDAAGPDFDPWIEVTPLPSSSKASGSCHDGSDECTDEARTKEALACEDALAWLYRGVKGRRSSAHGRAQALPETNNSRASARIDTAGGAVDLEDRDLDGVALRLARRRSSRDYPMTRALLPAPDGPSTHGPTSAPQPPPVPRTFFPAPRPRRALPPAVADLDEMLRVMADGLLLGVDGAGHSQVQVTLRDEFFAGTELVIVLGEGRISARLIPSDRDTYFLLNANVDELRRRLDARGLVVESIEVERP